MRESEFVPGETARIGLNFLCPLFARGFVQHVTRRGMVVYTNLITKFSTQQAGGWHAKQVSGQIPKRHLNTAGGAHEIVRRTVRASASEVCGVILEIGVQGVDLKRVFTDPRRFDCMDLYSYSNGGM